MGSVGGIEWIIIIVAIFILFFGAKKIPELARGIGQGINEFKDASNKELDDNKNNEKNNQTDSAETKTKAKS